MDYPSALPSDFPPVHGSSDELGPSVSSSVLDALIQSVSDVFFVFDERAEVVLASRAAQCWRETRPGQLELHALRHALAARGSFPGYHIARLDTRQNTARTLAVRTSSGHGVDHRVLRAGERWGLRPRAQAVLELVCTGASNKEIACELACAEVTVERYVTQLFRVSGAGSRAALVQKAHTL